MIKLKSFWVRTKLLITPVLPCGIPQESILGPLLSLLYINGLPQAVVSDSLFHAVNTCIVFQHKSEMEIEKQLIRDISSKCDWFVDNKLSIHFGQDKTKWILFGTKLKLRNASFYRLPPLQNYFLL